MNIFNKIKEYLAIVIFGDKDKSKDVLDYDKEYYAPFKISSADCYMPYKEEEVKKARKKPATKKKVSKAVKKTTRNYNRKGVA